LPRDARSGNAALHHRGGGLARDAVLGVVNRHFSVQSKGSNTVNSFESRLTSFAPWFLALLRVVAALLFMSHGTMKLLGFPASDFQPPLVSLFGFAGIIEITGSLLLILGLFTRPVAFILAGEMAVAYFMAHAGQSFFPLQNGGESAVLFCFFFLYLVFAGPGAAALDNLRDSGGARVAAQRAG
jgi:putative oxidoreductase